jgi:hypothetical protein
MALGTDSGAPVTLAVANATSCSNALAGTLQVLTQLAPGLIQLVYRTLAKPGTRRERKREKKSSTPFVFFSCLFSPCFFFPGIARTRLLGCGRFWSSACRPCMCMLRRRTAQQWRFSGPPFFTLRPLALPAGAWWPSAACSSSAAGRPTRWSCGSSAGCLPRSRCVRLVLDSIPPIHYFFLFLSFFLSLFLQEDAVNAVACLRFVLAEPEWHKALILAPVLEALRHALGACSLAMATPAAAVLCSLTVAVCQRMRAEVGIH